jgi:tripartite-type tricarboxylate transporter receptor subunit TctC
LADSVANLTAIKREPDKFTYGSIGRGSLSHLAMASLAMKAGANVVHLPFQGSPAAVTALLRGDVQMAVLPPHRWRRWRRRASSSCWR